MLAVSLVGSVSCLGNNPEWDGAAATEGSSSTDGSTDASSASGTDSSMTSNGTGSGTDSATATIPVPESLIYQ